MRLVYAIFQSSSIGQRRKFVAHLNSKGGSFRLCARVVVPKRTRIDVGAEIQVVGHREVDSHCMRQTRGNVTMDVSLLHVDAGTVGVTTLEARCQIALAGLDAVICALVLEDITAIEVGGIRHLVIGTKPDSCAQSTGRQLTIQFETIADTIVTADTETSVSIPISGDMSRALQKSIAKPVFTGIIAGSEGQIRTIALLLSQWHAGRGIDSTVVTQTHAQGPVFRQQVIDISFDRLALERILLYVGIKLEFDVHGLVYRHLQHGAGLRGIGQRDQPGCGVSRIESLVE